MIERIWAKLREWLVLIVGFAAIAGVIGIAALFQPNSEPSASVAAPAKEDTPKPMASPAAAAVPNVKQAAAAPTGAKQGAEGNTRTDSKQSSEAKQNSDTRAQATVTAAPAPQRAPPAAPMAPPAPAQQTAQAVQAPAPATHDHAATPSTTGQPAAAAASQPTATGDAAAGRQVFRKCQACHSLEAGKNGIGPSLANIVGEKAATVPGFNFSPAMRASNLTWDAATLDAYLTDPQKVVPGTKMPFPGLKTDRERSAVIAFLTESSKPGGAAAAPAPAAQNAQAPAPSTTQAEAVPPPSPAPGGRGTKLRARAALHLAQRNRRRPHGVHRGRRLDRW